MSLATLATNTNVEQRQALDSLLLQQERKLMMTEVDSPYACDHPGWPHRDAGEQCAQDHAAERLCFHAVRVAIVVFRNPVPERFRFWSRIWSRS